MKTLFPNNGLIRPIRPHLAGRIGLSLSERAAPCASSGNASVLDCVDLVLKPTDMPTKLTHLPAGLGWGNDPPARSVAARVAQVASLSVESADPYIADLGAHWMKSFEPPGMQAPIGRLPRAHGPGPLRQFEGRSPRITGPGGSDCLRDVTPRNAFWSPPTHGGCGCEGPSNVGGCACSGSGPRSRPVTTGPGGADTLRGVTRREVGPGAACTPSACGCGARDSSATVIRPIIGDIYCPPGFVREDQIYLLNAYDITCLQWAFDSANRDSRARPLFDCCDPVTWAETSDWFSEWEDLLMGRLSDCFSSDLAYFVLAEHSRSIFVRAALRAFLEDNSMGYECGGCTDIDCHPQSGDPLVSSDTVWCPSPGRRLPDDPNFLRGGLVVFRCVFGGHSPRGLPVPRTPPIPGTPVGP